MMKQLLLPAGAAVVILCAGCATVAVEKIPLQDGVYPGKISADTPLVVAVPGLRMPGLPVSQDQHFGHIVRMLTEEGVPCRIVPYDTREHPLARGASLFSSDLDIAWTRVGPAVVRELEYENDRRKGFGLPPVRRFVLFGYSQGGVIVEQICQRIFYEFKNSHDELVEEYGDEWRALRNDPEFKYFINELDNFLVIKNIKIQREGEFERSRDLRKFYKRLQDKVEKRFEEFILYLADPATRFPGIERFEEPGSPFYPKKYDRVRRWALSLDRAGGGGKDKVRQFFIDYAEYRELLDVEPYFVTASASFFGSPQANAGYTLFRIFPFLKYFFGSQIKQIKQTRLGSVEHGRRVERLARLNRDERYPLDPHNTLFILGANGSRGDGLVDQSSAHLSSHSYTVVDAREDPESPGGRALVEVEHERLPDLPVAPVETRHFPEKVLWGLLGKRYGTAYMIGGNPSYPYLRSFVEGDREGLLRRLGDCELSLRQFMLEISMMDARMGRRSVRPSGSSGNVRIDGHYFNSDSGMTVLTGHFVGKGQEMNLAGEENDEGEVRLRISLPGGATVPLSCTVYPGCNSFVRIRTGGREEEAK